MRASLIERDLNHIWHPCSQMKDYEMLKPIEIISAQGAYVVLKNGQRLIDATSSWWCKSLGHSHPRLKQALIRQMNRFEHVMLAHTTHETIVEFSEKLSRLTKTLNKVQFASDGSCAVEIAMKMSLHVRKIQGENSRHRFVALKQSYHGETIGALSVSDLGIYRDPYAPLLFDTIFLSPLPYVMTQEDALWSDCEMYWSIIEKQLNEHCHEITAILIEPIVQAANGMRLYSQDLLRRLRVWTKQHNIHLIADEIMTGIGRTGTMLACQHANIEPDFLCLSKGLTSGFLPLSVMLTNQAIYDVFYDDYENGKSFLHSHTQSGNALAASVALEVLSLFEEENLCDRAVEMGKIMRDFMLDIATSTKKITNVRGIGAVVAADLISHESKRRIGFDFYRFACEHGALMRPLGSTVYWSPPLTTDFDTLERLKEITERAIGNL